MCINLIKNICSNSYIYRPSSSTNGDLPNDYELAEKDAKINNNCTNYNSNCSVSFLDLISWIGESV